MPALLLGGLPEQYAARFPWRLDGRGRPLKEQRGPMVRELGADLVRMWQDLGGVASLSFQQQQLVERAVFLRSEILRYETAVHARRTPPMTSGEYSNHVNVLLGVLKALGLERRAQPVRRLRDALQGNVT